MDYKNIIVLTVGALVGVLILSAMIPAFLSTQNDAGDPVTYTNGGFSDRELYVTEDLSTPHTMTLTANPDGKVTYDGVDLVSSSLGFYVVSDGVTVCSTGAYMVICWGEFNRQYDANWGTTFDITWVDGLSTVEVTQSGNTTTYEIPYTWIGHRVGVGEGNYVMVNSTWNTYAVSPMNYLASGYYATGENDTYYCAYNGQVKVSENYPSSINMPTTKVDGTTDVYSGYLDIQVGDEHFNPYVWAVAKEIHGHKDSGALYEVIGLLPLIAGIGLLLGICVEVFRRYY